ncbi:MAG: AAA family ATPase [Gemmatimonadaceae bacterium]|nr:AAA family ATPase [Gemmatimonadaceae bacterium]
MAEKSSITPEKSSGKIPGRMNGAGEWGGIKWQHHAPSEAVIEQNIRDGGNFCLRMDDLLALDIDITDAALSAKVEALAVTMLGATARRVANAPKAMLLYRQADGEPQYKTRHAYSHPTCDKPAVEALGKNCQIFAIGRTNKGNRARWSVATLDRSALTVVQAADVAAFFSAVDLLLEANGGVCVDRTNQGAASDRASVDQDALKASGPDELRSLVSRVPNEDGTDRDYYIKRMTAIKAAGADFPNDAEAIALEWANKWSGVHGDGEVESDYARIKAPFSIGVQWLRVLAGDATEPLVTVSSDATPAPKKPVPVVRTLRELMNDPDLLKLPVAVAPRLAYAGRTTLLAMREKFGKSTIIADAVTAVSTGGLFLGEQCEKGKVLWCAEESMGDLVRRFADFGADVDNVSVLDLRAHGADRINQVCKAMEELRPAWVVIDTIISLTAGIVQDSSKDSQITPHISRLAGLAARLNCALLLSHHSTKSGSGYHGSIAYGALVDLILIINAPGDDQESPLRAVSAVGRWQTSNFTLRFDPSARRYGLSTAAPRSEDRVISYIRANPGASVSAVAKGTNIQKAAAGKIIAAALASGVLRDTSGSKGSTRVLEINADAEAGEAFDPVIAEILADSSLLGSVGVV